MLKEKFVKSINTLIFAFSYVIIFGVSLPTFAQDATVDTAPKTGDTLQLQIVPAIANVDVNGNSRRYEQYVTPSDGIYLSRFQLLAASTTGSSLLELRGHDTGESSAGESIWGTIGFGKVVLKGVRRNSTFFRDFSTDGQSISRSDYALNLDARNKVSLLNFTYQDLTVAGNGATPSEDWRRTVYGVNYANDRDNWLTLLGYRDELLDFRQGEQINNHNVTYGLTVAPPLTDGSTLEANAFFTQTSLHGISREPQSLNISIEGSHDFPSELALSGKLFYEALSHSINQSSYAKNDSGGQLVADYFGIPHAEISLGSGMHQVGYINDTHTARVNSIQNNAFAKFRYQFSKELKIKAYTSFNWTNDRPATVDLFTRKMASFVWSDKRDQAIELTYAPSNQAGITAKWRNTNWKNSDYASKNSVIDHDISAWWIPQEKYTAYASFLAQNFTQRSPSAIGDDTSASKTFVSGLSYQYSKPLTVDLAYNVNNINGATHQRLHFISIGANYLTKAGDRWSLALSFDDLNDNNTSNLDYDVNRIKFEYSKNLY